MRVPKSITAGVSALSMVFSSGALAEEDINKTAARAAQAARDVEFALLEGELSDPSRYMQRADVKAPKAVPERVNNVVRKPPPAAVQSARTAYAAVAETNPQYQRRMADVAAKQAPQSAGSVSPKTNVSARFDVIGGIIANPPAADKRPDFIGNIIRNGGPSRAF